MVAIFLMAMAASVVVLVAGGPRQDAREAAVQFATRLAAARDQAILSGQPMSAWVAPSGYGFDQYRQGHWQALEEKPFSVADWPDGTTISGDSAASGRARLRFDSLGMPDKGARFQLENDGRSAVVSVAANGDIRVN